MKRIDGKMVQLPGGKWFIAVPEYFTRAQILEAFSRLLSSQGESMTRDQETRIDNGEFSSCLMDIFVE